jgi:hypothetical protein
MGVDRATVSARACAVVFCLGLLPAPALSAAEEHGTPDLDLAPGGVVIEAEPLEPEPTLDQLFERFRRALSAPGDIRIQEQPLPLGALQVSTRFGRFCTDPMPSPGLYSDLTGGFVLMSRCTGF